jgi:prepilin-type N-terminal cleavage/methylation domain-containing protein
MPMWFSSRRRRPSPEDGEDGFTLIEMMVALAMSAIVLTALAGGVFGALRAVTVQKARTQGNEVATLGIESLQRLPYDELGNCAPPANPPDGLERPAKPAAGCPIAPSALSPFPAAGGQDPCSPTLAIAGTGTFVRSTYTCSRQNITYKVERHIAWSNLEETAKRLAVMVSWTDQVGPHTVSQQSSLRAPGLAEIAGLASPTITSVTLTPTIGLSANGSLSSDVALTAKTTGLSAGASTLKLA